MKELPPIEELHRRFSYNPETGEIRYRCTAGNITAGTLAGTLTKRGYRRVVIDKVSIPAHWVAWAMVHEEWPPADKWMDHKNGVRDDNRIDNLRLATHGQNMANSKRASNNKSGFKGVTYNPDTELWRASIKTGDRHIHFDGFLTPEDAHEVYTMAANDLFGEFANAG